MSSKEFNGVAGWYRTHDDSEIERYWDGTSWTKEVRISTGDSAIIPLKVISSFRNKRSNNRIELLLFLLAVVSLISVFFVYGTNLWFQQSEKPISPSTASATPVEPEFDETPNLGSADLCKIQDQRIIRQQPNNVGFPHVEDILPSQGDVNIVVVAVDFPDAPGKENEYNYLLDQTNRITQWGNYYSQGKINYSFQVHNGWVTVPNNSSDYVVPATKPHTQNETIAIQDQLTEDIIAALGSEIDFSEVHGLLFLFPPTVQGIEKDLGGRGGTLIETPQGAKELFYWGGGQYHFIDTPGYIDAAGKKEKMWAFWIHEMLHSQGISLHAPANGSQTGLQSNQYGDSAALDAWELFLLGWTEDSQIYCLERENLTTTNVKLNSSDVTTDGNRAVIVRLSDHEAIVVESRRPTGYSSLWPKDMSGIFAYKVDTTLDNDRSQECCGDMGNDPAFTKWAYLLLPDGKFSNAHNPLTQQEDYLIREGETVTYGDVRIDLVFSGKQDFVRITKK